MNEMTSMPLPLTSAPKPARHSRAKLYYISHYDGEIVIGMPQDKAVGPAAVCVQYADALNGYIVHVRQPSSGGSSVGGFATNNSSGARWNYRWKVRSQEVDARLPTLHNVTLDLIEAAKGFVQLFLPVSRLPAITIKLPDPPVDAPPRLEKLHVPGLSLPDLVKQINECKAEMGDTLGLRIDESGRLRASLEYA